MIGASKDRNQKARVVIAGGGPAGASAAIRLASAGFEVSLFERERFPRHKLCGEFISPECLKQFCDLGVLDEMLSVGGDSIAETIFYSRRGRSLAVPSRWFGGEALSLSRARMDDILLRRSRSVGVDVVEGASVCGIETNGSRVSGIRVRGTAGESVITGDVFIDATGRSAALTRFLEKRTSNGRSPSKPEFVAFKNHLQGARIEPGRCEIYFFPGGYGGLSHVESGASNFCFIVRADVARQFGGAEQLIDGPVSLNARASRALAERRSMLDWMAVSISGFGIKRPLTAANVFSVGDAGAFVDPFTGSGMLMALQSAGIAAECIIETGGVPVAATRRYAVIHAAVFAKRLRVCSMLRRAANASSLHDPAISLLGFSRAAFAKLARATR